VYNLCAERNYDPVLFDGRVEYFPFEDHNAPSFQMIFDLCENVQMYLDSHPENVAVLHCKAGKGRTGVMICCWMLYANMWTDAQTSLDFYGAMRTDNREGVTIPSQARLSLYWIDGD
jgi:phosphatidylinositol-3,4,5-trisphosphate 3-phosphatase/dual-specificity protein phosphatase PTEN